MKFKDGVYIQIVQISSDLPLNKEISPEIQKALRKVDEISRRLSGHEITVTSIFDGTHSLNSLHYSGNAFDIRIWDYTKTSIPILLSNFRSSLGPNFDVILESNHIHIEYQNN